jgi:hypothetical protein
VNKMGCVTESYSKSEVHTVVRFLQAEGVSQNEIHCRSVFTAKTFSAGRNCVVQQI